MTVKTYRGSCHCGAVRFEVVADPSAGTGRCNCSYCTKVRTWNTLVKPDAFRLAAGEDARSDYQFCRHCGIHPFSRGHVEAIGGDFVSVSIACLDDVTPEEFAAMPVTYADGRANAWWRVPAVTAYL